MSSITVDFLTLAWGTLLLVTLPSAAWHRRSIIGALMAFAIVVYLWAQSGWTTSYLSGYEWGRDVSNWLWFVFNSTVMLIFTLWLTRKE